MPAEDGLVVANVTVVDRSGTPCPRADNLVEFSSEGLTFLGSGNGNPLSHEADKESWRMAFHGLCQALYAIPLDGGMEAKVEVKGFGLKSAVSVIKMK